MDPNEDKARSPEPAPRLDRSEAGSGLGMVVLIIGLIAVAALVLHFVFHLF